MKSLLLKRRIIYVLLILTTIFLGLTSRKYGQLLPHSLSKNAGDALWATMVYFGFAFIWPKSGIVKTAVLALLFSFAIEFSQLYHALWIDTIRHTVLGHLVMGEQFVWGDFVSYAIGIIIAVGMDGLLFRKKKPSPTQF